VTLLDGDIVRHNLSSELTFSKEHRDINVKRIGFVASEITKNRGIAILRADRPLRQDSRGDPPHDSKPTAGSSRCSWQRPWRCCEQRDRKGMYAKARAGLIKGYTGIDDPYEAPESPKCGSTPPASPGRGCSGGPAVSGAEGFYMKCLKLEVPKCLKLKVV